MRSYLDAKAMRDSLSERDIAISHSAALEIVAKQFGLETWNVLSAKIDAAGRTGEEEEPVFEQAVPIVRIFDVAKAHEFYLGFLGFSVDWEHRFGENFPLYTQVSRGGLRVHLSEHSGDATPGSTTVAFMKGIRALHAELMGKKYRYMKPGLEKAEWGLEATVIDPFNNRIRFIERHE